jgi:transposase-like protein
MGAMNLSEVSRLTEAQARELFERVRWPNGPFCPHCKSTKWIKLCGKAHRDGLYKCHGEDCGKQFTATVNTILEDTHLPIRTWLMAFAILCSAKKGISALQLQRQLGIGSYRSAWHLCHRIRHAMGKEPLRGLLLGANGGDVAVDEAYIGGRPRKPTGAPIPGDRTRRRVGRATPKQPVVALIERGGRARAQVVADVTAATLKDVIRKNVDRSARIMTDEFRSYQGIGKEFAGGHVTVDHSKNEYARDGLGTNEAEAFFALLKRGIVGSFHHVSKHHLQKYVDEFSYRWDHRKISDSARTADAIRASEGKRLMLKEPVEKEKVSFWDL